MYLRIIMINRHSIVWGTACCTLCTELYTISHSNIHNYCLSVWDWDWNSAHQWTINLQIVNQGPILRTITNVYDMSMPKIMASIYKLFNTWINNGTKTWLIKQVGLEILCSMFNSYEFLSKICQKIREDNISILNPCAAASYHITVN